MWLCRLLRFEDMREPGQAFHDRVLLSAYSAVVLPAVSSTCWPPRRFCCFPNALCVRFGFSFLLLNGLCGRGTA